MKILLADDHSLVLAGTSEILRREESFDLVGAARSEDEVLVLVGRLQPDVLLLELGKPALACLERVRSRYPEVKVVVVSMLADLEQAREAFRHGACGYIVKSSDGNDLAAAIRQAVDGTAYHAVVEETAHELAAS